MGNKHYYNEFNPESAAMLRQMMADGVLPVGDVDERSITEVRPDDIKKYTQCHFFAGIGGWSFALALAGWPEDRPVWTGSCPCQPFSSAGRQAGKADDRHLWPVWQSLISECRPPTIYGEQVATAVAHGWLDDVFEGLEAEGYACGAVVLPASSVGAPHRRERLWFVADSSIDRRGSSGNGLQAQGIDGSCHESQSDSRRDSPCDVADTCIDGCRKDGECVTKAQCNGIDRNGGVVGDTCGSRSASGVSAQARKCEGEPIVSDDASGRQLGAWEKSEWIGCPDGKARLVKSGIPLLVDGFQHRKPILHALGNAIVPQVAAAFIRSSM